MIHRLLPHENASRVKHLESGGQIGHSGRMFRPVLCRTLLISLLILAGFSLNAAAEPMPAGVYTLDPKHTSVIFTLNHLGFSRFTGRFDRVEGHYTYDPVAPEKSDLDVTIYPDSIDTNVAELDEILRTENWFNTLKFPQATFHLTHIELTGDKTAKITGDFTLHDVTHRLTLDAVLVGAGKMPFLGTPVMGFSATGHFNRSDYGISNSVPMVGDRVDLEINTEFDKEK
ncbi:MAG: YceI family protein [Alphaproteobacteria bacterium]